MKNILGFLFLSILLSCTSSSRRWDTSPIALNEKLYVVNLDNVEREDLINLSTFFKDVETIILETNDDCIIGEVNSIRVLENYVVVMDSEITETVLVFDKAGHFLHRIGQIGQGPGEYIDITDSSIDFEKKEIYLIDYATDMVHKYDIISGEYINSLQIKTDNIKNYFIQYVNGKIYTSTIPYSGADASFLLQEFDVNTGKPTASYLNVSEYNKGWNDFYSRPDGFFYPNEDGCTKYTQMFMDSVISICNDEIMPFLAINIKNWITEKDIQELIKFQKENNGVLSHELLFKRNISYNINHYFDLNDLVYFQYRNSGNMEFVFYNTENNTTRRADFLKDDIVYSGDWFLSPSFAYADSKGVYSYLKTEQIPRFLELSRSGGINKNLDKLEFLEKLPEDSNPVIFYYTKK